MFGIPVALKDVPCGMNAPMVMFAKEDSPIVQVKTATVSTTTGNSGTKTKSA